MEIADLLKPSVLLLWLLGMVFGVFVGATPGLTATMAVALIVPIAISMEPAAGLAMIIGVSFTAIFAGDIPATYLRIPGTPASAAATLDGHEMAKKGHGRLALMIDLVCSSAGGLIGVAALVLVAPLLARVALAFTYQEMFWLAIFGLSMSAVVSQGSTTKGMISAVLGMLLATLGTDVVGGSAIRYTFGWQPLEQSSTGFFIPAMIGLFGLSEVLRSLRAKSSMGAASVGVDKPVSLLDVMKTVLRNWLTVLKSAISGTCIGALPGAGADIAAWAAYGLAQKTSRAPEKFGHGCDEGVVAPTSANNAAVAGAWIPALVFGVPGDAVTAIVLGALIMYEIRPGPTIFERGGSVYTIFAIAAITQVLLLPAGYLGIRAFGLILRLPRAIVLTAVVLFSVVGSYAINSSLGDVYIMLAFGLLGYFLESQRVPLAPLILGLILGEMIERNLRTALIAEKGDWTTFFTHWPSPLLIALLVAALFVTPVVRFLRKRLAAGK